MNIRIEGAGAITTREPVPDDIVLCGYPLLCCEPHFDGGLHVTLSPYPEVYDEDGLRQFLLSLAPFIDSGRIDCRLVAETGPRGSEIAAASWSYTFRSGHWYRSWPCGSCTASEQIDIPQEH